MNLLKGLITIYYKSNKPYPGPYSSQKSDYLNELRNNYNSYAHIMQNKTKNTITEEGQIVLKDYGPELFAINITDATLQNDSFRTTLWTGDHLQLTLMSIGVGEDIGLEIHPELDQFIRIEEGEGQVRMGDDKNQLDFKVKVYDDFAFIIPAGKWHNLINTGDIPLKLYSIYAPPQHPVGTVHETKEEAMAAAKEHEH